MPTVLKPQHDHRHQWLKHSTDAQMLGCSESTKPHRPPSKGVKFGPGKHWDELHLRANMACLSDLIISR